MQCVVLAGGLGRRMLPQTEHLPKCLLLVAGRPFVDWQLEWLAAQGVEQVIMSIGYRGDLVRRHLGDGSRFGLQVRYVDDGDVAARYRRCFAADSRCKESPSRVSSCSTVIRT